MYYFRFTIPEHKDGSKVRYSSGWHGTMPKCPKGVTVLVYNDKDGYGIAQTEDTFQPEEVTVIEEAMALETLNALMDTKEDGIYFGEALDNRWLEMSDGG